MAFLGLGQNGSICPKIPSFCPQNALFALKYDYFRKQSPLQSVFFALSEIHYRGVNSGLCLAKLDFVVAVDEQIYGIM